MNMDDEQKVRAQYQMLTKSLIQRKLTLTTMESVTGGLLASLITDTEGSSAVLREAFVTYSNEAKIRRGVPGEVIEAYGVYSRETALAMAKAAREETKADIAVGVTGSAGNPDPENPDSVCGQVWFAIDFQEKGEAHFLELPPCEERFAFKMAVAGKVAEKIFDLFKKA